jgi:hypothetical protein
MKYDESYMNMHEWLPVRLSARAWLKNRNHREYISARKALTDMALALLKPCFWASLLLFIVSIVVQGRSQSPAIVALAALLPYVLGYSIGLTMCYVRCVSRPRRRDALIERLFSRLTASGATIEKIYDAVYAVRHDGVMLVVHFGQLFTRDKHGRPQPCPISDTIFARTFFYVTADVDQHKLATEISDFLHGKTSPTRFFFEPYTIFFRIRHDDNPDTVLDTYNAMLSISQHFHLPLVDAQQLESLTDQAQKH